jgi:hypothetical protein
VAKLDRMAKLRACCSVRYSSIAASPSTSRPVFPVAPARALEAVRPVAFLQPSCVSWRASSLLHCQTKIDSWFHGKIPVTCPIPSAMDATITATIASAMMDLGCRTHHRLSRNHDSVTGEGRGSFLAGIVITSGIGAKLLKTSYGTFALIKG